MMSRYVNEEGPPIDSRFDGGEPFPVSPDAAGISLDSALHDFGPAAIDDLIPRIRSLAHQLDAAHAHGHVHGALNPRTIFIDDEETSIIAGHEATAPYAAPEVLAGEAATPESDQFSLAAVTYEWLFDKRITGPADRPVEVRSMPGVERGALSRGFSRALSRELTARYPSCTAFCEALAAAVIPELPLLAAVEDDDDDDPVEPFAPESTARQTESAPSVPPIDVDDLREEPELSVRSEPQLDPDFEPVEPDPPLVVAPQVTARAEAAPVASWNPPPSSRDSGGPRFGALALIAATLVGSVFGFAAGYMARPRALQSEPPARITVREPSAPVSPSPAPAVAAPAAPETPARPTPSTPNSAPPSTPAPAAAPKTETRASGRLLVRSTPSGATVTVDGVARGVTPVALRDLEFGTRTIVVARRGYESETHRVAITSGRSSRSLDVRLSPEAAAKSPRPGTPASLGRPGVTTGGLMVESRPSGASVSINGRDRGKTPLTLSELPPGDYQVVMTLQGYRNFATTVRVVAGERARAAASLTAVEQE